MLPFQRVSYLSGFPVLCSFSVTCLQCILILHSFSFSAFLFPRCCSSPSQFSLLLSCSLCGGRGSQNLGSVQASILPLSSTPSHQKDVSAAACVSLNHRPRLVLIRILNISLPVISLLIYFCLFNVKYTHIYKLQRSLCR